MIIESFSGVRGIYKTDIDENTAKRYAEAYIKFLMKSKGKPLIAIGRDTRASSEKLKDAMIEVFLQYADVIDVGINTTPAIEFAVRHFKADGGVIITASHNEPEYNGWKFLSNTGSTIKPGEMDDVIKNYREIKNTERKSFSGKLEEEDIRKEYSDFVLDIISEEGIRQIKETDLKAVVDPNGGTAAVVIKEILQRCGVEIIEMNMGLGTFKRKVEPNAESLKNLAEKAKKGNADIGAGFDCDADRVELIDDKGNVISGHYVLALLVEEVLSNYRGFNRSVVINDATSNVVRMTAEKYGFRVYEVEVGEINVVEKMDEMKSPVGGEGSSSGGIFPPSRCRDGIITMLMILRLMARTGKRLSELYEEMPRYFTPRAVLECSPEKQAAVRKVIEEKFKSKNFKIRKTGDESGGLKIVMDDESWLWFRASKTEAGQFRIMADSNDESRAKELLQLGKDTFREAEAELA